VSEKLSNFGKYPASSLSRALLSFVKNNDAIRVRASEIIVDAPAVRGLGEFLIVDQRA
jgi:hypothetical protein